MGTLFWHQFCGHGENFTAWLNEDFGHCFEQIVVICPSFVILTVFSAYYIAAAQQNLRSNGLLIPWFVKLRIVCTCLLALLAILAVVLTRILGTVSVSYSDIVTSCVVAGSWLVHVFYVFRLKYLYWSTWRGAVSVIIIYQLTLISLAAQLHTTIVQRIHHSASHNNIEEFSIYTSAFLQLCYLLTLVPKWERVRLVDDTSYGVINEEVDTDATRPILQGSVNSYRSIPPRQRQESVAETPANCLSRLTFHWVQPLMVKGARGEIKDVPDIFLLPDRLSTSGISGKFAQLLDHKNSSSYDMTGPAGTSDGYMSSVPDVSYKGQGSGAKSTSKGDGSLLKSLHSAYGVEYYSLGILKLMADCFGFAGPILLNLLVSFMETKSEPEKNGYIYAAGLFAATLFGSIFSSQFDYNCRVVGFKLRTAIITTIYRKSLSVHGVAVNQFSTGQITNFMSTDTDRIVNFCPSFHAVWSLPFQIGVSLYLLYQQVGVSFVAGLVFAIILIPINRWLAIKIGQLSTAMMEQKDNRVKVMNEILFGMRVVKFYAWEDHFRSKINALREAELKSLKGRKYLDAMCVYFWATTPVLISILTFTTYSLMGNQLTAAKVFTSLSLFLMLISPLNAFPWVLNGLMEAWVSLKRVQAFVALRDLDLDHYYSSSAVLPSDCMLHVRDAEFSWQQSGQGQGCSEETGNHDNTESPQSEVSTMKLCNINLQISKGQFVGVIGKVGSGKSSLLSALLAEMCRVKGHIRVADLDLGFALAAQEPWIQHATIRDNILFGRQFNSRKYDRTVEACALTEDLKVLPSGDKTEVGENGVTLSGGQKARLSLARAVYQNKEIYLLDDPLAAVDAHVAEHLYKQCIMGLLWGKTRILCTHHTKYLQHSDLVIVMDQGKIVNAGLPSEILESVELWSPEEEGGEEEKEVRSGSGREGDFAVAAEGGGTLVEEEERETGVVRFSVYKSYWRAVGSCLTPAVLLALFFMQGSRNINDWWLSYWVSHSKVAGQPVTNHSSDNTLHSPNDTLQTSVNLVSSRHSILSPSNDSLYNMTTAGDNISFYLTVYGCLAGANSVFTLFRAFLFAYGGICAARVIHQDLLASILKAPISFFDITPIGRIVNRFSSDVFSIDDALPFILNIFLAQSYGILGTLVITCYGLPWFTLMLIPLGLLYYKIQNYYRHTSRELKRISSVSLSPIYAHFSETISGLMTIRAMRESERFKQENIERLDANQRAQFASQATSSWLGFRLQMLGVAMVTAIAFIAVLEHHFSTVSPGLVGLAISYILSITGLLSGVVTSFTETEKQMVSVERAHQYIDNIPEEQEEGLLLPPPYWPIQGSIQFHQVKMRYRPNLPFALKNVTFEVEGGEKVGIVGRTGSGKSSLFLVLFRMVEAAKGHVFVDGIDLHHLDLKDIRSRLAIIPQDPFLFSGSVRENVDPTGSYRDGEIWAVFEKCHLKQAVSDLGGLEADVAERGRHFSVGQRQLMCLARALLTRAKVICIDEATASVDLETDMLIQQTIHTEFRDSTVLTIAHRINTVIDSDKVLVMKDGVVAEFAAPGQLLSNPGSIFYRLVHGNNS